ncbi:MAG: hypothetical protein M1818_000404 [Claussenomyces sp. TS43310]|nr:MAG: hypothetical protein M1818_000404 [Claussenomyces sp. TS43310]
MPSTTPLLSSVLPPLIFGTATFNSQYNIDPFQLPTTTLVHKAFAVGVRAFDTSPYYGPAEELLGRALHAPFEETGKPFPRDEYYIITKVGRIAGSAFNYSKEWVYRSIQRSLKRLHTDYLDVVYCHDVEFVSSAEVLVAVRELRRIRDTEGTVKYIGISGYPVHVLCELAELVLRETGESLDCVMNYANHTLQNTRLAKDGIERLVKAGVQVVPNASILGMGLLRRSGVPTGGKGNWHPAPDALREAIGKVSKWCDSRDEKIEVVAIRWALESWLENGGPVGSCGDPASGIEWKEESIDQVGGRRLGVSVMGVSNLDELDETMKVWRSILDGLEAEKDKAVEARRWESGHQWSLTRRQQIRSLAAGVWEILGAWKDYAWESPGKDYVRVTPGIEDL